MEINARFLELFHYLTKTHLFSSNGAKRQSRLILKVLYLQTGK